MGSCRFTADAVIELEPAPVGFCNGALNGPVVPVSRLRAGGREREQDPSDLLMKGASHLHTPWWCCYGWGGLCRETWGHPGGGGGVGRG